MRLTFAAAFVPVVVLAAHAARRHANQQPAVTAPASAEGAKLFVAYNCADCHGGGGSGLMAPSLADNRWHYGGTPQDIYASIVLGRPDGMPTWGPIIPPDQVAKLVAYVSSLGMGKDVSTMNFTAKIQRTGH